jgi:hypothetical protein
MIGDDNNRHLGVAFDDHRPKPALATLAFVNQLFAGGFQVLPGVVARPDSAGLPLEAHGFLLPDGTAVVTAWIPTHPNGSATGEGAAADDRRLRVELVLPCPGGQDAHLHDERGQRRGDLRGARDGPRLSLDPLEVRGGEVTIAAVPGCSAPRSRPGITSASPDAPWITRRAIDHRAAHPESAQPRATFSVGVNEGAYRPSGEGRQTR